MTEGAVDRPSPELTILVPVKDEQDGIEPFLRRVVPILEAEYFGAVPGTGWEILFVDDGSTDNTWAAIQAVRASEPHVQAISLSRNFGKEAALSAGLDYARGRAIIPIDVDLQDSPEAIPEMLARWREGYQVVYGIRRNRAADTFSKRATAHLYYLTHNFMSNDKIPAHAGDFRLLDRVVVDVIRRMPERNRFMKGLFSWAGFRQSAVEYDRSPRDIGQTKFRFWKLWTLALDGIASSSTVPLRVWSYIGGAIAALSMIYAAVIVARTLIYGIEVPGYASLLVIVLLLGGVQLLSLGVLGEYVGRIFTEVKGRPLYVVRDRLGSFEDQRTTR